MEPGKGSSVERQLWRVRLDGTGLSRVTSEPGTHNITMSPDAAFYVDARSNVRTLPSLSSNGPAPQYSVPLDFFTRLPSPS